MLLAPHDDRLFSLPVFFWEYTRSFKNSTKNMAFHVKKSEKSSRKKKVKINTTVAPANMLS